MVNDDDEAVWLFIACVMEGFGLSCCICAACDDDAWQIGVRCECGELRVKT